MRRPGRAKRNAVHETTREKEMTLLTCIGNVRAAADVDGVQPPVHDETSTALSNKLHVAPAALAERIQPHICETSEEGQVRAQHSSMPVMLMPLMDMVRRRQQPLPHDGGAAFASLNDASLGKSLMAIPAMGEQKAPVN